MHLVNQQGRGPFSADISAPSILSGLEAMISVGTHAFIDYIYLVLCRGFVAHTSLQVVVMLVEMAQVVQPGRKRVVHLLTSFSAVDFRYA